MLPQETYHAYCAILHEELVPAMGCTEPIAVAYAAAYARDVLGQKPVRIEMRVSANIIKNVKGVTVPNTNGMRGLEAAAIAGIVGGDPSRKLEVLQTLKPEQLALVQKLVQEGMCSVVLAEGVEGLFIEVVAFGAGGAEPLSKKGEGAPTQPYARVVVEHTHTGIALVEKNGRILFDRNVVNATEPTDLFHNRHIQGSVGDSKNMSLPDECAGCDAAMREFTQTFVSSDRHEYTLLNVRDILEFADTVRLSDVEKPLKAQAEMNEAIAREGLKGDWGVSVGKTLMKCRDVSDVRVRARAMAAAGSDARMAGCPMPVVINSGSGNQGLTVSLPVIEFARDLNVDEDKLLRALVVSNLVALEQKEYVGKLSAYCGAVSAAVGAAAGIAYLKGATYEEISSVIINAIATADGILCDGAKSSCAAKIVTALESSMLALDLGIHMGKRFREGEGLVGTGVEETIRNVGIVAKNGMRATDAEVIRVMLGA